MEEFSVKDLSKADLVAIVKQQKKMIDNIKLMVKAHAENNHVSAEDFADWLDNEAEMVIIPKKKYKEYGNDKLQMLSAEDLLAKMLNCEPEQYSDYKKDEYMNVC